MANLDSIKKQRHHFANKDTYSLSYGFSSSQVWKLSTEELMLLTGVLQKTLESPLDCKEVQPVNPKEYQSWIFIGRIDAEAPILWPPDAKNCLIWKDPDAGKDWRWEEKGTTEDEMVGWHHWLCGHEFEQAPVVGDGQGGLVCCSPWGRKELDRTEHLNWTELNWTRLLIGVHLPLGMTLTGVDPRDQRCDSKKVRLEGKPAKVPCPDEQVKPGHLQLSH